jgi:NADH-quinone oxidoreductase subunit I
VYHKEQLLEPMGSATTGSLDAWSAPAPEDTRTPLPGRQGYFDGLPASAAAVGQGDLPAEQAITVAGDAGNPQMTGPAEAEEEE